MKFKMARLHNMLTGWYNLRRTRQRRIIIRNLKKRKIGHCTHTTESAHVKVQTYFTGEITLHVAKNVNTEQLQHSIL
jgi:hypothetical protein